MAMQRAPSFRETTRAVISSRLNFGFWSAVRTKQWCTLTMCSDPAYFERVPETVSAVEVGGVRTILGVL